jgi:hypothetical protein
MKLFIMQCSATSRYIILFRSKYSQQPVLRHGQSMFSLNVRDKISHPYKTGGKIEVLYILMFMFLDGRLDKF